MAWQQAVSAKRKVTRLIARTVRLLRRLRDDSRGATAIEYAVMASLIGGAIAATVWNIGTSLKTNWYDKIAAIFS
jgi:Flp pilus assembly pilin Flp